MIVWKPPPIGFAKCNAYDVAQGCTGFADKYMRSFFSYLEIGIAMKVEFMSVMLTIEFIVIKDWTSLHFGK